MSVPGVWLGVLALLPLLAGFPAQASVATGVASDIRQVLARPAPVLAAGTATPLYAPALLRHIYAARADSPGWVGTRGPRPAARAMLEAVRASRADGLNPDHYHLQALEHLIQSHFDQLPAAQRDRRLAALELLLSDAFLALARDARHGRVNPATFAPRGMPADPGSPSAVELDAVLQGETPVTAVRELAPTDAGYRRLRVALARYLWIEAHGGLPRVPPGPALRTGARGPRVTALIRRLKATGDVPADLRPGDAYDAPVEAAVVSFQARHGLAADGIVGPATLTVLNQPVRAWVDKLRVNLERIRWLPRKRPSTRVVVNIADFRATLYHHDKPVLSERAVVGKPYQQTPEFRGKIRYLVTDPAWEVPQSIAARELLPAVQRNRGYLTRHGYAVLEGWGANARRINPATVDWARLSAERLPFHFRQGPGPANPLGRVEFIFPNPYDVYMHDTPARQLFRSRRRTFSHGCIRVEHAMQLAAALLRLNGQENPGLYLIDLVASGETRHIHLPDPVPIYIVYRTAWVEKSGMIEFRDDVYGRDAEVLAALDAPLAARR